MTFHGALPPSRGANPVFGKVGVGATTGVGTGVGVTTGVPTVGVGVGTTGTGVGVGAGVTTGAVHVGTVIVSALVVTVPPKANDLPTRVTVLPMVMPDGSMFVPTNVELAPSVVAAAGVQNTSQADAPPVNVTAELATVVSAPLTLKI